MYHEVFNNVMVRAHLIRLLTEIREASMKHHWISHSLKAHVFIASRLFASN